MQIYKGVYVNGKTGYIKYVNNKNTPHYNLLKWKWYIKIPNNSLDEHPLRKFPVYYTNAVNYKFVVKNFKLSQKEAHQKAIEFYKKRSVTYKINESCKKIEQKKDIPEKERKKMCLSIAQEIFHQTKEEHSDLINITPPKRFFCIVGDWYLFVPDQKEVTYSGVYVNGKTGKVKYVCINNEPIYDTLPLFIFMSNKEKDWELLDASGFKVAEECNRCSRK